MLKWSQYQRAIPSPLQPFHWIPLPLITLHGRLLQTTHKQTQSMLSFPFFVTYYGNCQLIGNWIRLVVSLNIHYLSVLYYWYWDDFTIRSSFTDRHNGKLSILATNRNTETLKTIRQIYFLPSRSSLNSCLPCRLFQYETTTYLSHSFPISHKNPPKLSVTIPFLLNICPGDKWVSNRWLHLSLYFH